MTMVTRDITEAGTQWSGGIPAQPIRDWQRIVGHLKRLDRTIREFRNATTRRENNDE